MNIYIKIKWFFFWKYDINFIKIYKINDMCYKIFYFSFEVNFGVERLGFMLVCYYKGIFEYD